MRFNGIAIARNVDDIIQCYENLDSELNNALKQSYRIKIRFIGGYIPILASLPAPRKYEYLIGACFPLAK